MNPEAQTHVVPLGPKNALFGTTHGLAPVATTFRDSVAETQPELTRNDIHQRSLFPKKNPSRSCLSGLPRLILRFPGVMPQAFTLCRVAANCCGNYDPRRRHNVSTSLRSPNLFAATLPHDTACKHANELESYSVLCAHRAGIIVARVSDASLPATE